MAVTINGGGTITGVGGIASAWVNFNGTGTVAIRASGNVSSITDNGTGDYTVNFTTAFADTSYCAVCSAPDPNSANFTDGCTDGVSSFSTGSCRVKSGRYSSGRYDNSVYNVACFR